MSQRYKGAVISATPPTVSATSPNAYGTAKGVWTLQQQMQYEGGGTWPSPFAPTYIEDVFSTYLYTGNGSTQTITNGIDLSGKGGLAWGKRRNGADWHTLVDTVRGAGQNILYSNSIDASNAYSQTWVQSFLSNGFTVGGDYNANGTPYASWTFRKAEKFFDVVTYTGTGGTQILNHSLGSVPGCLIMKSTSGANEWVVNHRSLTVGDSLVLNQNYAASAGSSFLNEATSTTFKVPSYCNALGETYVAYLFAHDAGGFGDSGSENVISCGSFTHTNGTATNISLGWEAQWVLIKRSNTTGNWLLIDNMRGMPVGSADAYLSANTSDAEASTTLVDASATGFIASAPLNSGTYIYIAIRRGPMAKPTSGTNVFSPVVQLADQFVTTNFPVDSMWSANTSLSGYASNVADRLRGGGNYLDTRSTAAEDVNATQYIKFDYNNGVDENLFNPTFPRIYWNFRRAPGFMDIVCYTTPGSTFPTINHNLGVKPELIIVKQRNGTNNWGVQYEPFAPGTRALYLNSNSANGVDGWSYFFEQVNSTSIQVATSISGYSAGTFVTYLFASCPGVSKVGSYTGTGTTLQINCGFTSGARFVMIKRTDSTGDWYVWDSARGIVAGNDPYLLLNSTAAEVTNTDYVDTYSAGFEISSTAPAAINANGGTFIYLAIA